MRYAYLVKKSGYPEKDMTIFETGKDAQEYVDYMNKMDSAVTMQDNYSFCAVPYFREQGSNYEEV